MENIDNTLTAYLGQDFQTKLMWQILTEPEFGDRVVGNLSVEYFDDPNLKRLFVIISEYFKEYEKTPNTYNNTIDIAINKFKSSSSQIELETMFSIVKRIKDYDSKVINGDIQFSGDIIQKETITFIKQQEWRKFGEFVLDKTKSGEIRGKSFLSVVDEKINKISFIGDEEDEGVEVKNNIDEALNKEFRETIPTGITVLDGVTGGGLGKGEIGLILTPSGVGKTTTLTKIANAAYDDGKKVLQIIFEDTKEQITRKHLTIWSKVSLEDIDDNNEFVKKIGYEKAVECESRGGKLIIKEFSQENTTIQDIRIWIDRYQKKHGFKFEILILDYLDCLESAKKGIDRQEAELSIVKSFLALSSDLDIPAWSAIQSNRSGFESEFLEVSQMGGNVKRYQKAHFFMSIAKPVDHKENNLVNIKILKARFIKDGQTFKDSILDNGLVDIKFNDSEYQHRYSKGFAKVVSTEKVLEKCMNSLNKVHAAASTTMEGDNGLTVQTYVSPSASIPIQYDEIEPENVETNLPEAIISENKLVTETHTTTRSEKDLLEMLNNSDAVNNYFS